MSARGHLEHIDVVERPSVRCGDARQLRATLRQRDVQPTRPFLRAREQELERERGLAGAGLAVEQVEMTGREAAAKNLVETGDARTCFRVTRHAF